MDLINLTSFLPANVLLLLKFLIFFVFLEEAKWLFPPGEYLTLPFLVILKRLATPRFVFSFPIFLLV